MIPLGSYHNWTPNPVMIKDPESNELFGNVLGDVSKAEQVSLVVDAGDLYSLEVRETCEMYKRIVGPEANRCFQLVDNMTSVYESILEYYDLPEPEIAAEDEYEPSEYTLWEPDTSLTGVPSMTNETDIPETEEPETETPTVVEAEGTSYNWPVISVMAKNPESGEHIGNVFGDLSRQEQVAKVNHIGDGYQFVIAQDSENYKRQIVPEVTKRNEFRNVMNDVFDAMAEYYDYEEVITEFVLDSSTLDTGILG